MTTSKPPLRLEHELIAEQLEAGGATYVANLIIKGGITDTHGIPFWAATRAVEVALGLAERIPLAKPVRDDPRPTIIPWLCLGAMLGFALSGVIHLWT